MTNKKPKLLDQVCHAIRVKNYSYRTEKAYVHWIRRYILHFEKRHPAEMGKMEVEEFLRYLAHQKLAGHSLQPAGTRR